MYMDKCGKCKFYLSKNKDVGYCKSTRSIMYNQRVLGVMFCQYFEKGKVAENK
jgi:hypothetical protein